MKSESRPDILSNSANLVGFCFVVLTTIHGLNFHKESFVDEFTVLAIIIFMCSGITGFLCMRKEKFGQFNLVKISENLFFTGLIIIFLATMVLTFEFYKS